jgi:hypothetical protein
MARAEWAAWVTWTTNWLLLSCSEGRLKKQAAFFLLTDPTLISILRCSLPSFRLLGVSQRHKTSLFKPRAASLYEARFEAWLERGNPQMSEPIIVLQQLATILQTDSQKIRISTLFGSAVGMNHEIFQLEKSVQTQIPICEAFRGCHYGLLGAQKRTRMRPDLTSRCINPIGLSEGLPPAFKELVTAGALGDD